MTVERAYAVGVDCIEAVGFDFWDDAVRAFCERNGLCMLSGSDVHEDVVTSVAYTLMKASDFTAKSVYEELVARRTVVSRISWFH